MKQKKTVFCKTACLPFLLLFLSCLCQTMSVQASGNVSSADQTGSPYFYIPDADPSVDRLPLKETHVSVQLNGSFAETRLVQTYVNEGTRPIHASYLFPASSRTAVHGMTMQIGDELIRAKIKEKEEAKAEYDTAKEEGKSASLLEEKRPNVFSMDVANIMPGDTIILTLHYTELIPQEDGICQFVFPTVVGPRYTPACAGGKNPEGIPESDWTAVPYLHKSDTPPGEYTIEVQLSAATPVTDIHSSSHAINTVWETDSSARITLADPTDYAGNRDFILDYKLTGEDMACGLLLNTPQASAAAADTEASSFDQQPSAEQFFLLSIQPPERYEPEDIVPREYIFVLDISGSMDGYPLDTAKYLIRDLVSNLREGDCFNLVLFSDTAIRLSPESLSATPDHILQAVNLIDEQQGGGGTELTPALEKALAIPQQENLARSVITITDGYISNEQEIFALVNQNLSAASFFSFGIGDAVNRHCIDGIAKAGGGEAFVVTDSEEALDTAAQFRTYVEAPLLTDIEVTYDGFDVYDVEPPVQTTLFARRPITLFGKYHGAPGGTIRITGKNGPDDYVREISVADQISSAPNSALPYLWARTRIERLSDYGFTDESREDFQKAAVKREVTALGLKYSILTPYTSFIAVSEKVRNTTGDGVQTDQPLPLPSNVSHLAVGGYLSGSEPDGMLFLLFLFLAPILRFLLPRLSRRFRTRAALPDSK